LFNIPAGYTWPVRRLMDVIDSGLSIKRLGGCLMGDLAAQQRSRTLGGLTDRQRRCIVHKMTTQKAATSKACRYLIAGE